uniref:Uncharacterized protein n=1 Tax=Amphimedon queenslandica TaxID=400682 RepID=A0A1X7TC65_AMPQE
MEALLHNCGFRSCLSNAPMSDTATEFENVEIGKLQALRSSLFGKNRLLDLTDVGSDLVKKKGSVVNPLRKKLIDDILKLDRCIKNNVMVPRVLLSGGTKSKEELEHSCSLRSSSTFKFLAPASSPPVFHDADGSVIDADRCSAKHAQQDGPHSVGNQDSLTIAEATSLHTSVKLLAREINRLSMDMDLVRIKVSEANSGSNASIMSALVSEINELKKLFRPPVPFPHIHTNFPGNIPQAQPNFPTAVMEESRSLQNESLSPLNINGEDTPHSVPISPYKIPICFLQFLGIVEDLLQQACIFKTWPQVMIS